LVGFFYLLKLTCKVCNDCVVVMFVFIEGEGTNKLGVVIDVVVPLFDEWLEVDKIFV
jgi:hypothetical protein